RKDGRIGVFSLLDASPPRQVGPSLAIASRLAAASPNSPAKRIVFVQNQRRSSGHMRPAADGGDNFVARPHVASGKGAAQDALLHPKLPLRQFAVGGEARQLRGKPGAARRAVVLLPWAQDKVT